ncbi:MAG: hypothetical protein E6J20_00385 [Chloroflexi bacterium]|nr:MAG: hypothetical protein E6J20_00385 [Chloroflexota bacterium]
MRDGFGRRSRLRVDPRRWRLLPTAGRAGASSDGHPEIHVPDPIERELQIPRELEYIPGDRATETVHRAIGKVPDAAAALRLR